MSDQDKEPSDLRKALSLILDDTEPLPTQIHTARALFSVIVDLEQISIDISTAINNLILDDKAAAFQAMNKSLETRKELHRSLLLLVTSMASRGVPE